MESNSKKNIKQQKQQSKEPAKQKKSPKVQLDPYTAEVHQIMSKKEISGSDMSRMEYLIEDKKAKMNGIGQDGKTLLEKAIYHNSDELFQFLLSKGADINQKNGKLETPLHIAALLKNPSMMDRILSAHPDVNAQNSLGQTPLLIAVLQNDGKATAALLEHQADPNISAKGGNVPLTEVKDAQIASELLQHGAHVNVTTDQGKDPLKQAENLKDDKLIATMLDAQLKEEKHFSDPNADVQHKEETLQKQADAANQANGPVDAKAKEGKVEEQPQQVAPADSKIANSDKIKTEDLEALKEEVQKTEKTNQTPTPSKEDISEMQVLAKEYNVDSVPQNPAEFQKLLEELREKKAKENSNQRLTKAVAYMAECSKTVATVKAIKDIASKKQPEKAPSKVAAAANILKIQKGKEAGA